MELNINDEERRYCKEVCQGKFDNIVENMHELDVDVKRIASLPGWKYYAIIITALIGLAGWIMSISHHVENEFREVRERRANYITRIEVNDQYENINKKLDNLRDMIYEHETKRAR